MKKIKILFSVLLIQLMFVSAACAQEGKSEKGGEEDGTQIKRSQAFSQVKKGVKLVLKYNEVSSKFEGVIINKSNKVVKRARVEVHLSNGVELGPTKGEDIRPGGRLKVVLSARGQNFTTWSTHAEVGSNEHGHGKGGEEANHSEKGEHNGEEGGSGEH